MVYSFIAYAALAASGEVLVIGTLIDWVYGNPESAKG